MIVLLVALVIVLLLVARSWKSVAPEAMQVSNPDGSSVSVQASDHGETEAGEAVRSGDLPDLNETKKQTDAHAQQVQEALAATE